ncbi:hypothetical protein ACQP1P_33105 [Dactylosporangium sp. CA-052675]|uniref:hypothetical protein n=1 Tax=Dactylosporangium sp. CA-052675 TaxID=3239927 RepID=UPI003D8FE491
MKVSWSVADGHVAMPDRSLVDGARPVERVELTAHSVADPPHPHRVRLPIGSADAARFRRFDRIVREQRIVFFVVLGVWVSMVLAAVLLPGWGFRVGAAAFAGAVLANGLFQLVSVMLRPRQYPVRTGLMFSPDPRVVVRGVHPDAATEWRTVAGDSIRIEP